MSIVTVRRISQVFFLCLFCWLCIAASVGGQWWQMRGWPINFILSLDPLTAIASMFSTGRLYAPLLWSLATLALTVALGRFFCGFACPLGVLNQFFGWLGQRSRKPADRVSANRPQPARVIKYYLLIFLLAGTLTGSLLTGIFDPLPLLHRSINLTLAPIVDSGSLVLSAQTAPLCLGLAYRGGFDRDFGLKLGRSPVFLPLRLPFGGAFRAARAFFSLAHRQGPGSLPPVFGLRSPLRRRLLPFGNHRHRRMPDVLQLPARLPARAHPF